MFAHPSGKQEREEGLVLIREIKFAFQRAPDFSCVLRTVDAETDVAKDQEWVSRSGRSCALHMQKYMCRHAHTCTESYTCALPVRCSSATQKSFHISKMTFFPMLLSS